jgi:hypothetical protein
MTGTTVFPSCPFVCVVSAAGGIDPRSPDGVPKSVEAGDAVAGGGGGGGGGSKGDAGDEPRVVVPCGTTIGGKRYIRHQLMLTPGLRSEPATVRRVGICGAEGSRDDS